MTAKSLKILEERFFILQRELVCIVDHKYRKTLPIRHDVGEEAAQITFSISLDLLVHELAKLDPESVLVLLVELSINSMQAT